jgi:hypothetical protein
MSFSPPSRRRSSWTSPGPTMHGFRTVVAQWLDLATPPHGLSSGRWSPVPAATATRLAQARRDWHSTQGFSSGRRELGRPRRPTMARESEPTPHRRPQKQSCARSAREWRGGDGSHDIYKGISVISYTPWFLCPVLDVQINLGRREY